eukprot:8059552-Lingulodinium_polyedra.AAC.1
MDHPWPINGQSRCHDGTISGASMHLIHERVHMQVARVRVQPMWVSAPHERWTGSGASGIPPLRARGCAEQEQQVVVQCLRR